METSEGLEMKPRPPYHSQESRHWINVFEQLCIMDGEIEGAGGEEDINLAKLEEYFKSTKSYEVLLTHCTSLDFFAPRSVITVKSRFIVKSQFKEWNLVTKMKFHF